MRERPRREDDDRRESRSPSRSSGGSGYVPPPPRQPVDPFFERPYEASTTAEPASWEKAAPAAPSTSRGHSPNIKPKRKVAALFGAKKSAPADSGQ
jgi:hypothetical protein